MEILEIAAKMSGFRCRFCKGSLMKVHYPKLYNMAHLLALNVLLLPKDLTIIFINNYFYLRAVSILKRKEMSNTMGSATEKVQVGNDQEKAQSEKIPTPKIEAGKNQTNNKVLIP